MFAVKSALPVVAVLVVSGVVLGLAFDATRTAPQAKPMPIPDPLVELMRDPASAARYLAAVSNSCTGGGDDPTGTPQPLHYVTDGGYTIKVDFHTVTITDPAGKNTIQHWGDPHENLNGKHIKDWGGGPQWHGLHRTVLLGDDSKVTMEARGPHAVTQWTAIYDGDSHIQFDNCRNQISWQGNDYAETGQLERTQYDGETASFITDPGTGVARYDNLYNEDESLERVDTPTPLGTTGGLANPNQVNDLIDDPRLAHT